MTNDNALPTTIRVPLRREATDCQRRAEPAAPRPSGAWRVPARTPRCRPTSSLVEYANAALEARSTGLWL